ncbi:MULTISPECIES: TniB family NTP-binding protein [unclassified Bradyrhizobium]|uniref:TniB family NTP-binding protein n=1 Tax=unclassified Bradyrhizobium TaxID=2631580 RepID=UPI0028ECE12E|nr:MULTISPECIES: TniB family NTP-binding protein [unclassified Bradyrhizobium]
MTSSSPRRTKSAPPPALPEPPKAGDFESRMLAKLSSNSRRTVEILRRVKGVYVACGRDAALRNKLDLFLEHILSYNGTRRDDGRIFFITGESGAGKSTIVRKLIAETPVLQPERRPYGLASPIVSVSLTGPCTLNTLGEKILEKAGYPIVQKIGPSQLWMSLPERLGHREIMLVHIDETQNMLKKTRQNKDRKDLANALKGAMNDQDWPISFIMSGLPLTTDLARLDEQFERRGFFQELPDIDMESESERKLVLKIIKDMTSAADIKCDDVLKTDIPDRVAHAANYRYGRTTQVVLATIHDAVRHNASSLHRNHFASAYLAHSNAQGHDEMNPFLADDWRTLPPGSFIFESEEE